MAGKSTRLGPLPKQGAHLPGIPSSGKLDDQGPWSPADAKRYPELDKWIKEGAPSPRGK